MARSATKSSQPFAAKPLEFGCVNRLESDPVAGAQGKIALGDMNQFQRRAAEKVPTAGPLERIDSGLPPSQTDAAGLDAQARRW
jgi:hypothetical protein